MGLSGSDSELGTEILLSATAQNACAQCFEHLSISFVCNMLCLLKPFKTMFLLCAMRSYSKVKMMIAQALQHIISQSLFYQLLQSCRRTALLLLILLINKRNLRLVSYSGTEYDFIAIMLCYNPLTSQKIPTVPDQQKLFPP